MADSLLDLAGVPPQDQAPPPNQAVLDQIAGLRRGWEQDVANYAGNGLLQYGPFSPGGNAGIVANNPELSGYFDVQPGGSITPHAYDPQQVAAQSGQSLAQLMSNFNPRPLDSQNVDYQLPNDRGGFFRLQDAYIPAHRNIPSINTWGASDLSTNNWRLLPMGYNTPQYIMRNGVIIDRSAGRTSRGFPSGRGPATASAEHGSTWPGAGIAFGTGVAYGVPNLFASGSGPASAGWPGAITWRTVFPGQ